jgi:hypothetical protein
MDNKIKKYLQFIKEADESELIKKDDSNYDSIKEDIKKKIEETIEKNGGEFKSFIKKFEESPKSVYIEGLINDSDIYDFYQTHRLVIDELLTKSNYFKKAPEEVGVYQYVIDSTKEAIELIVKMLAE